MDVKTEAHDAGCYCQDCCASDARKHAQIATCMMRGDVSGFTDARGRMENAYHQQAMLAAADPAADLAQANTEFEEWWGSHSDKDHVRIKWRANEYDREFALACWLAAWEKYGGGK